MHFHVFNVYCLHKRHSHSFSCSVIRFTSSAKPFTPCHSHITIYTRKKAGLVSFLEWTQFSVFLLVGKGGEYVQYVGCFLFIVECNRSIACGHHTLITSSPPPQWSWLGPMSIVTRHVVDLFAPLKSYLRWIAFQRCLTALRKLYVTSSPPVLAL